MALSIITAPNQIQFAGNQITYRVSTANPATNVQLELSINGSTFTYKSFPDSSLVAEFRIESGIQAAIAANTLPIFGNNTTAIALDSYAVDITQTPDQVLDAGRQAIAGAFKEWQYPARNPAFFANAVTLLTDQPARKRVSATQREYLYFLTTLGSVDLLLNNVLIETIATNANTIYAIDTSAPRFGLTSGDYTVSLSGIATQAYRIDLQPHSYAREYIYQNNFAAWEVLRTTGRREKTEVGKAESAVARLPYDYTQATARKREYNIDVDTTYLQRSGWLSKAEMEYLSYQLAATASIYEILQDGSLLPYIITNRKFKFNQNAIGQQSLPLELQIAY